MAEAHEERPGLYCMDCGRWQNKHRGDDFCEHCTNGKGRYWSARPIWKLTDEDREYLAEGGISPA